MNEQHVWGGLWIGAGLAQQTDHYVEFAPTMDAAAHQVNDIVNGAILTDSGGGVTESDFGNPQTTGINDSSKMFDIVVDSIWSDHSITGHIDLKTPAGYGCYSQCVTHQWTFTFHPLTVGVESSGYSQEGSNAHGQFTLSRVDNCACLAPAIDLSGTMTFGGTAMSGSDYTPLSNRLNFAAGHDSAVVQVFAKDDKVIEWTEDVTLSLPQDANFYIVANKQTARVEIVDNDPVNIILQNLPEESTGTPNETDPGAFIPVNDNDNNGNGIPDGQESVPPSGDPDVSTMLLYLQHDVKSGATVTFSVNHPELVRVFRSNGTELHFSQMAGSNNPPLVLLNPATDGPTLSLRVEAIGALSTLGGIVFQLKATDATTAPTTKPSNSDDKVNARAVEQHWEVQASIRDPRSWFWWRDANDAPTTSHQLHSPLEAFVSQLSAVVKGGMLEMTLALKGGKGLKDIEGTGGATHISKDWLDGLHPGAPYQNLGIAAFSMHSAGSQDVISLNLDRGSLTDWGDPAPNGYDVARECTLRAPLAASEGTVDVWFWYGDVFDSSDHWLTDGAWALDTPQNRAIWKQEDAAKWRGKPGAGWVDYTGHKNGNWVLENWRYWNPMLMVLVGFHLDWSWADGVWTVTLDDPQTTPVYGNSQILCATGIDFKAKLAEKGYKWDQIWRNEGETFENGVAKPDWRKWNVPVSHPKIHYPIAPKWVFSDAQPSSIPG